MKKTARAHSNIALAKYWGKRDEKLNLPAVGSISLTLAELYTETSVECSAHFSRDEFSLNGKAAAPEEGRRVSRFLNWVREQGSANGFCRVESRNNFPTGAGLASSASAFAALAVAATAALGVNLSKRELSVLARRGSGSAARSIFGGFVEMRRGEKSDGSDSFAVPLAAADFWPLTVLIAVTSEEKKSVGSTAGMRASALTSPYYDAWVHSSEADLTAVRTAILARDFERLAETAEHNCLKMHALMLSSRPALIYWNSATLNTIHLIRELRARGWPVFFTIDAGPQVKAICETNVAQRVSEALQAVPGVRRVLKTGLGPDATLLEEKQ